MNQEKARAYLKRIGFEEPVEKDEKTLDRLLRAHLEQVPFENLDVIHLGKVPSLEEEELYDKIVGRNRGGYCCWRFLRHLVFPYIRWLSGCAGIKVWFRPFLIWHWWLKSQTENICVT